MWGATTSLNFGDGPRVPSNGTAFPSSGSRGPLGRSSDPREQRSTSPRSRAEVPSDRMKVPSNGVEVPSNKVRSPLERTLWSPRTEIPSPRGLKLFSAGTGASAWGDVHHRRRGGPGPLDGTRAWHRREPLKFRGEGHLARGDGKANARGLSRSFEGTEGLVDGTGGSSAHFPRGLQRQGDRRADRGGALGGGALGSGAPAVGARVADR